VRYYFTQSLLLFTFMIFGGTVATVSQLFYAQRIHMLSGKKLISGVVIVVSPRTMFPSHVQYCICYVQLAFVQFAFGIYTTFASYGSWTTRSELFAIHNLGYGIDVFVSQI
jgi:hypothetical protein